MCKKIKCIPIILVILLAFGQTVFAANYTPSITYKPIPPITEIDNKQNIPIYDKNSEVVQDIPWGDVVVTAISDIDSAKYEDIRETFGGAYNKLSQKSLYNLCPDLQSLVETDHPGIAEHQLVVKDLFHLAVYGTYRSYLEQPGNHIFLTFKTDISENEPFYVLFCTDGGEWKVIQPEYVVRHTDGTVTVRFDETGSVAFLTGQSPLSSVDKDNPEYTSAQTGYEETEKSMLFLFIGILCALSVGVIGICKHKKTGD